MKHYFITIFLCFNSLIIMGQDLAPPKTSPFTAVRWENEQPIVQFNSEWYHLEKLGALTTEQLLDFVKKQFANKWQKRFSEDLVEVLGLLGYQPKKQVVLRLSKSGVSNNYIGTFTSENRNSSVLYNKSLVEASSMMLPQKISIAETLADLKQFDELLSSTSSYSQLSTFDYKSAIKKVSDSIATKGTQVDIDRLTNAIAKIMAEIGDRHSSVKNGSFDKQNHKTYNLKLPFGVATLNGKIIGIRKDEKGSAYWDYIKSIDGVAVEELLDNYNYRDKKAPEQARLARGSEAIQRYGKLLFDNDVACPDSVAVVFSDGNNEKTETFSLTTKNVGYAAKQIDAHKSFEGLSKIVKQNIGYINIPEMYNYEDVDGLESYLKNTLNSFSGTKALIIDIRNNPGGGREILQTFASYIVQAKQSPWVANVAYLRTGDEESMSDRFLYGYHSSKLSNHDRKAIDKFSQGIKYEKAIATAKFSDPFYMVLRSGKKSYKQPVYILVNEHSFSAASVFASAFKNLTNVKIVGETTDGSSGNSKVVYLKNSNISITVSTMLSFQRNGKTLDGNGTTPDIVIHADEKQVLKGYDSQLNNLIDLIN